MTGWEFAIAAVIAAVASGIASYAVSQATRPSTPPPPPPAGYKSDEGEQVWNPLMNRYEWVLSPAGLEKKKQEEERQQKIRELEAKLNQTEPERAAEWDKAANAYVERMMGPLSQQYEKARQNLMEDFSRRGLGDSKAMTDALADLEKSWMETKADVQNRAIGIREDLAQRDFENKLNVIQSLRQGSSLDEAERVRQQGIASQQAAAASAINNANWENHVKSTLAQWAYGMQAFQSGMQAGSNLALIYGLSKGGTTVPKTGTQAAATQASSGSQIGNLYVGAYPYFNWYNYPRP